MRIEIEKGIEVEFLNEVLTRLGSTKEGMNLLLELAVHHDGEVRERVIKMKTLSPSMVYRLEEATSLFAGDYMENLDYEWLIPERERYGIERRKRNHIPPINRRV